MVQGGPIHSANQKGEAPICSLPGMDAWSLWFVDLDSLEEPVYTTWKYEEVKTLKGLTSVRMVILKKVKEKQKVIAS